MKENIKKCPLCKSENIETELFRFFKAIRCNDCSWAVKYEPKNKRK
jgi:hypothetical protein